MKQKTPLIYTVLTLLLAVGWFFVPHILHAQEAVVETISTQLVASLLAYLSHVILSLCSWFVTIAGIFLNWSIHTTTHLQSLYNQDGLRSVWITIRDLSSLFVIFMLLFSALKMIVGVDGAGFGKLIGKIFIAGLFINFSLFFVRVGIDVSNIVSLQFYDAIAPQQRNVSVESAYFDGGISNIFMNSLKLPKIYNDTGAFKKADINIAIFLATVGGIIMMVVAGLSFMAAAIAFTVRTAILLFAMVISPLLFLNIVFPGIPLGKIRGAVQGQLIFMPVYLGLMYIALRIISDPAFLNIFKNVSTQNQAFGATSIGVIIQYLIALAFINFPLVTAISMSGTGGYGMKWAPTASVVAGTVGGWLGRNTVGRGMSKLKLAERFDNVAARATKDSKVGQFLFTTGAAKGLRSGLEKTEKGKYGGSQTFKEVKKEDKTRLKDLAKVRHTEARSNIIDRVIKDPAALAHEPDFEKTVRDLKKDEVNDLGFKKLSDKNVIVRISTKQFDALMDDDSLTEEEKDSLKKVRKEELNTLLGTGISGSLKDIVKNLSGKELSKLDPQSTTLPGVLDHVTTSQLKEMGEEMQNAEDKRKVLQYFTSLPADTKHGARGWILKNRTVWS